MKYVIQYFGGMPSKEDQKTHMQEWYEWIEKQKKNGTYIDGYPYSMEAKVVKGPEGKVNDYKIDDEIDAAGYSLMEYKSWEEALEEAKNAPHMKNGGWVKIRECKEMSA